MILFTPFHIKVRSFVRQQSPAKKKHPYDVGDEYSDENKGKLKRKLEYFLQIAKPAWLCLGATAHWSIQSAVPQLPIPAIPSSSENHSNVKIRAKKANIARIVKKVTIRNSFSDLPYLLKKGEFK